jgi:uroporphyrinogen-III synthase
MLGALEGFTVGVTADRRAEEQALLIERVGGTVLHAPCIRTLPLDDGEDLRAVTLELIRRPPDVVVVNTAIGMRGWFEAAASWGLEAELLRSLAQARILARGPKAAGAVTTVGLAVSWRAPAEQLAEVAEHLGGMALRGQRVAVQLHGDRHEPISAVVRQAGGEVVAVPVYRWDRPVDVAPVAALVDAVAARRVDAVTFTSSPAMHTFFELATELGRRDVVTASLGQLVEVACVGPVCERAALAHGITNPVVPGRARLGSMVRALGERLGRRQRHLVAGEGQASLLVQGAVAAAGRSCVRLTERERAVLEVLAAHPGAVVSRVDLLRAVWGDPAGNPHVVDVTVARLRAKLGDAGVVIATVVRRGYRLNVTSAHSAKPA